MSWLRNTSLSFARQLSRSLDPRHDYEPQACFNSFCKHWQQAYDIILRSHPHHLHDDVLGVVNHLEQLTTLLILEARARELTPSTSAACLEHLLSEGLLDKLYEWQVLTGKYENAVRLEQLKLFGTLVSHYSSQVIAAEPFLRPLLKLLSGFRNELPPTNVESQLVILLNQLCVALMQNIKFVDLFFLTTHTQNGSQAEFIIVRLLLSSVHREGSTGSTARDALLLCAKMSALCPQLAACMIAGNTCPVLATGLSGLYSLLPRTLCPPAPRLAPDTVNRVHKLTLFIDSLEFCNAVAQVAHPSIKKHLLDLLYQGFLVPVMGPALLQQAARLQSGISEQAASMQYLELALRCVTQAGLLRTFLHFLLRYQYDGVRVVDVLLGRLEGDSHLSLVSLALMETLIDLNSEDVMLELVYKYLLNGHHLPIQRHQISDPELYREAAVAFLSIRPICCLRPIEKTREWVDDLAVSGRRLLEFKRDDDRRLNGVKGDIAMSNLVQEVRFNYGNPNETLFGNIHTYYCDARFQIVSKAIACSRWSSKYNTIASQRRETNNNTKETREIDVHVSAKEQDSLISICTSGYDTLKNSDTSEKEPPSLSSLIDIEPKIDFQIEKDSQSIGESSDYESLKCREESEGFAEDVFSEMLKKSDDCKEFEGDLPFVPWKASAETIVGPLLSHLLQKASTMLESSVAINCLTTSCISKLLALPAMLSVALLSTRPARGPQLFQILSKLRDELHELTSALDNADDLVDKARVFLIRREMALCQARGGVDEENHNKSLPIPKTEESPFRRVESKRRSLSSSFSNMFNRRSSASPSPQSPQSIQLHTSTPQPRLVFTQEAYWDQTIKLRSILNAVLLDEWLKELSAICEEHALRLSAESYEDDVYVRTVAL